MFFGCNSLLLRFWALLLTIFKSFMPFRSLFTSKTNLSDSPKQSRKVKPHGRALPTLGVCSPQSPVQLMRETFHIRLYQHGPSPPLEAKPTPSNYLGSSRRTEKVHCTVLLHTMYVCASVQEHNIYSSMYYSPCNAVIFSV
jgi:hypothetical protein